MTQYQMTAEDAEIFDLFHNRCIVCSKTAVCIHEIEPRSHGGNSMLKENRVTLCAEHHDLAHKLGTKHSIPFLKHKRKEFLERYEG